MNDKSVFLRDLVFSSLLNYLNSLGLKRAPFFNMDEVVFMHGDDTRLFLWSYNGIDPATKNYYPAIMFYTDNNKDDDWKRRISNSTVLRFCGDEVDKAEKWQNAVEAVVETIVGARA